MTGRHRRCLPEYYKLGSMNNQDSLSDQERIKLQNKNRILKYMQQKRECTKQDIGKDLNLSIPTVTNNLIELQKDNIVLEKGQGESSGGRRPALYLFNPESLLSLGVEITPHGIRCALIDLDGKIQNIDKSLTVPHTKEELYNQITELNNASVEYMHNKHCTLAGIGISLPGVVDVDAKKLITAPNLHLSDIDFNELQEQLNKPVYIENEANAAATAEKIMCNEDTIADIIYLSITEGVGAGIYLENKLYRGRRNKAGEIGHICLIPGGRDCNCGQRGCLERYVSEEALISTYNQKSHSNLPDIDSFFTQVDEQDQTAASVLDRYIDYLSMGIQNLLHMFDPSTLIIGGNLAKYSKQILPSLKERLFSKEGLQFHSDVSIKFSDLGSDASLLGSAILCYDHLHY